MTVEERCNFEDEKDESRPGDLFIRGLIASQDCAVDIGITSPFGQSALKKSMKERGSAAAAYEKVKLRKYEKKCKEAGVLFVPPILESTGGMGKHAKDLIDRICVSLAVVRKTPLSRVKCSVKRRLSFCLQRVNARGFLRKCP